jgi:hypothetical protein
LTAQISPIKIRTIGLPQITLPAIGSGLQWNTGNLDTTGTISVAPEPSTVALLAAATIGLIGYGWRRRKRKRSLSLAGVPGFNDAQADSQEERATVLSLPSAWTTSARRAA